MLYGYVVSISASTLLSAGTHFPSSNRAVFSVANIRGGGEYGEKWHKAVTKCRTKCFDDFIGCCRKPDCTKIHFAEKLSINGGSNVRFC